MSILVNGSPTEEIDIKRGLKQGDPLAPFLFLLVAKGFSGLMKNAVNQNLFKGFEVKRGGTVISYLQYADDTLCIGEASVENLWTLKAILRRFELVSGLRVNFHKGCLIVVNVSADFLRVASSLLNCKVGDSIHMPVNVNKKVEGIQRRFLWGGVGIERRFVGLSGVRLLDDDLALWKEVLEEKYGPLVSLRSRLMGEVWPSYSSRWWKYLMGLEDQGVWWFRNELVRKVGVASNTFFWKDPWVSNVPLMEAFPCIYSLDNSQDGMRLAGVVRGDGVDVWVWKSDKDGVFSVKSCFLLLQNQSLPDGVISNVEEVIFCENWRSKTPGKVLAFSWTFLLDRIPIKVNLAKRRLLATYDPKRCVFCDREVESVVHLFLHCEVVSKVWREVCGVDLLLMALGCPAVWFV
ncbi:uncharacterized protein [Medicago truncatula]|uniref:uncharacterized protein n=1 Tax=Medicago truncatula TaxID=3880 RepID=UPI000D2F3C9C|nr:uncharacterized protein LOC112422788 [Medicago truncatula]